MPENPEPDETQILGAMLGISEMVGGLSDLRELLGTVVRIAPQLVRCNRCLLFLLDERTGELRCEQAFGPDIEQMRYASGLVVRETDIPRLSQKVIKQHLPALIRDATKEEPFPASIVQRLGFKTMLIAPLVCRDRTLGMIVLDDTRGIRHFTSKEINVVGGIATMAAIAIDCTTLREGLATEGGRLEAITAVCADAFLVLDTKFRIKFMNPQGEELLGWKAKDLIGRQCSEIFSVVDVNGVRACGSACPGQRILWGEDMSKEVQRLYFLRKNGDRVPCDVRVAPVKDAQGSVTEIVYVLVRAEPARTTHAAKEPGTGEHVKELEAMLFDER